MPRSLHEVLQLVGESHGKTNVIRARGPVQVDEVVNSSNAVNKYVRQNVGWCDAPMRIARSYAGVEAAIRDPIFGLEGLPVNIIQEAQQARDGSLASDAGDDALS